MASSNQVLWCGWNKPHTWRNFHQWHPMCEPLINPDYAMRNEAYASFYCFQCEDKLFYTHRLFLCPLPYKNAFLHISHTLQQIYLWLVKGDTQCHTDILLIEWTTSVFLNITIRWTSKKYIKKLIM
jgi:hypothetical protein